MFCLFIVCLFEGRGDVKMEGNVCESVFVCVCVVWICVCVLVCVVQRTMWKIQFSTPSMGDSEIKLRLSCRGREPFSVELFCPLHVFCAV